VCLLVAALFVVLAGYFVMAPVQVQAGTGKTFDCGTAINGPKTEFARGLCGAAGDVNVGRAVASGVAALVVAVGGLVAFGFDRREDRIRSERPSDAPVGS
jgi:hypothetical protein